MSEAKDETAKSTIAAIAAALELERDEGVVAAALAAALELEYDEGAVATAIAAALAAGAFTEGVAAGPVADDAGFWGSSSDGQGVAVADRVVAPVLDKSADDWRRRHHGSLQDGR